MGWIKKNPTSTYSHISTQQGSQWSLFKKFIICVWVCYPCLVTAPPCVLSLFTFCLRTRCINKPGGVICWALVHVLHLLIVVGVFCCVCAVFFYPRNPAMEDESCQLLPLLYCCDENNGIDDVEHNPLSSCVGACLL